MVYPHVYFSATKNRTDFLTDYEPSLATWAEKDGTTLLTRALCNGDPASRVAIATRLLDDGAHASAATDSQVNALHVSLSATAHDFAAEAPLTARLLDEGADINADSGSQGARRCKH
ncbi:hypothetical protein [Cryobacterium sp. W22_MBD10_FK3]|uniref:hypothetical protein n=1 Tax=Cryobacterium sp. W22_MBD10_FK3 TaxID=3240273 RepID=UPI003F93D19C